MDDIVLVLLIGLAIPLFIASIATVWVFITNVINNEVF